MFPHSNTISGIVIHKQIQKLNIMETRNKIGFRLPNEKVEPMEIEIVRESTTTLEISNAHLELKKRVFALEDFLTSTGYTKLSKEVKKFHIDSLTMFVAIDAELNAKSGICATVNNEEE